MPVPLSVAEVKDTSQVRAGRMKTLTTITGLLENAGDEWSDQKLAQEPGGLATFRPRERTERVRGEAHYFHFCCCSGIF